MVHTESNLTQSQSSNSTQYGERKAGLQLHSAVLAILLIYALWNMWRLASIVTIQTIYLDSLLSMNSQTSLKSDEAGQGVSSGKLHEAGGNLTSLSWLGPKDQATSQPS